MAVDSLSLPLFVSLHVTFCVVLFYLWLVVYTSGESF